MTERFLSLGFFLTLPFNSILVSWEINYTMWTWCWRSRWFWWNNWWRSNSYHWGFPGRSLNFGNQSYVISGAICQVIVEICLRLLKLVWNCENCWNLSEIVQICLKLSCHWCFLRRGLNLGYQYSLSSVAPSARKFSKHI